MITQSRLTQLLQKRAKKPRKFARPTLPDKAERLYLGAMRRYADVLIEVMRDQLGYRKDSPFDWRSKQAEHKIPLDEVADLTIKHGKAQAKRVLGLADQDMAPGHLIRGWKAANVALIQGLTDDSFDSMRKLIDQTRGRRVEDIADQIEGLFGTTRARAELIARDQTLKLNAQINQEACKTAGIEWYTWSTSRDKSVRDTHAELDGKKFRFDDPPIVNKYGDTANPGEDYQCRCVPIPYVPEIDEESEQGLSHVQPTQQEMPDLWQTINDLVFNGAEALPEELPLLGDGETFARVQTPFVPKGRLINPDNTAALGERLRAAIAEGELDMPSASLSKAMLPIDKAYQEAMYFADNALIDKAAQEAISKYSLGYDWLIRQYQQGLSYAELVDAQVAHVLEKSPGLDPVYVREQAKTKVKEAMRAAHELERAFYMAEDSPYKVTYRGIGGLSEETLNKLLGSDQIDMLGSVASTSWSPAIARNFAQSACDKVATQSHGVFFELHRKSKGVGIEGISQIQREHEVLLHGNTRWKVKKRQRLADYTGMYSDSPHSEMWHLVLEEI